MQSWLTIPQRLQQKTFKREERLSRSQKAILDWARIDDHSAILDMDCGDGRLLTYCLNSYQHIRACGILPYNTPGIHQEELIQKGAEVLRGEKYDIPWRDQSFDTVFINRLPSKLEDSSYVLSDIKRVLKPGAQLLITQPGLFFLPMQAMVGKNTEDFINTDHPRSIMSLLQAMDFTEISTRVSRFHYATVLAHRPAEH